MRLQPSPAWSSIEAAIAAATGAPFAVERRTALGGGCINAAYRIEGGGATYFVKVNTPQQAEGFAAEAAGLEELARSRTVRVPRCVCHGADAQASWLVLEHLTLSRNGDFAVLGRALAAMHESSAPRFGWHRANAIGATPQVNTPAADWVAFWREHRLGFQLKLAADNGFGGSLQRDGEALLGKLAAFFADHAPRPALLHGDLWSGNVGFDEAQRPVIFDPAVYFGDREADLAMTELFGGFPAAFYGAYQSAAPLEPGYAVRKDLYNLYHVLNHLNLFGHGYLAQAGRMIRRLLAAA